MGRGQLGPAAEVGGSHRPVVGAGNLQWPGSLRRGGTPDLGLSGAAPLALALVAVLPVLSPSGPAGRTAVA